jgi:Ni/Co efflux regulator RcnB
MRKIVLTALAALMLVPTAAPAQTLSRQRAAWLELRETNVELFRKPAYEAPRGLRHPRVTSGDELAPAFYDKSFWIEDFATYRLPPLADDQQYIRYGNDVVRVNVRSGRVIRVYKDFFLVD